MLFYCKKLLTAICCILGERCCGERPRQGRQAGSLVGRLLAAGLHPPHREDAQGAARHRPRGQDRLQRSPGGEAQGQFDEEAEVLRLNGVHPRVMVCYTVILAPLLLLGDSIIRTQKLS